MTSEQIETRERTINDAIKARNGGTLFGSKGKETAEERKELDELTFRDFIISCYCYGTLYNIKESDRTKRSHTGKENFEGPWGEYGRKYGVDKLGEEKALEILFDQVSFMDAHASIHRNVYTDCESCSYNSITWN